jgi:transforming growth factor-beta-induced protein
MRRKFSILVLCFLLILAYERCKTFAGANPSASVWSAVATDQQFSILKGLLESTGWAQKLSDRNTNYTLFAPTNDAFQKLGADKLQDLRKPQNLEQLKSILEKHIFTGALDKESLVDAKKTPASVGGKSFPVERIGNRWHIGNARPTRNPEYARNGMVYVIDAVLE